MDIIALYRSKLVTKELSIFRLRKNKIGYEKTVSSFEIGYERTNGYEKRNFLDLELQIWLAEGA